MPNITLRILSAKCHRKDGEVEILIEQTIVRDSGKEDVAIIRTFLNDFDIASQGEKFTSTYR